MTQDALERVWFYESGGEAITTLLRTWFMNYSFACVQTREVVQRATTDVELRTALAAICPEYGQMPMQLKPKPLSNWLFHHENRRFPMIRADEIVYVRFVAKRRNGRDRVWHLEEFAA